MDAAVGNDRPIDTPMIDAPGRPCDVAKPFGAPVLVPGVNAAGQERFGFLSSDELTIYLSDVDSNRDIFVATRTSTTATFSTPALLAGVNTNANEEHPSTTSDGLLLFLESNNFGSTVDIVVASRSNTSADFGSIALVSGVNTTNFHEVDATISRDGLTIVFGSNRNGDYGVFHATRASTTTSFGTPVELTEVDSTASDGGPVLSSDGLEILFWTDRDGGDVQVYRATRATASGPFGTPQGVTELNSAATDVVSWLSADRCRVLLTSDRLGTYDIFMATRPQ